MYLQVHTHNYILFVYSHQTYQRKITLKSLIHADIGTNKQKQKKLTHTHTHTHTHKHTQKS